MKKTFIEQPVQKRIFKGNDNKYHYVRVKVYCVENGKTYNSQTEAAKDLNIPQSHISRCLSGKAYYTPNCKHPEYGIDSSHGYHFKKVLVF